VSVAPALSLGLLLPPLSHAGTSSAFKNNSDPDSSKLDRAGSVSDAAVLTVLVIVGSTLL